MKNAVSFFATVVALSGSSSTVNAAQSTSELPSVMVISKSSNRNEVHYAVRVDEACAPAPNAPVRAYWRMKERGPDVTEGLTDRERAVVGIATQESSPEDVRFTLGALPSRRFVVRTARGPDGACTSL